VARQVYLTLRHPLERLRRGLDTAKLRLLDRFKLNDLDQIYGQEMMAARMEGAWQADVSHFCQVVWRQLRPTSVADVGCGPGAFLAAFRDLGVEERLGLEGSSSALRHALVPEVARHDLRDPFSASRRYEVVLCVEVAEHLHKRYAGRLVDTVTGLCEPTGTVVFTAAPPGQDGVHHINLQPKEFWIELFRRKGFTPSMALLDAVQEQLTLERTPWLKRNLMVFQPSRPVVGAGRPLAG
jgi:hypothetical protein